jgi:DNA-binding winged helix-turn-helix (wHTH) protein/Tol biopolymer transport system component
VIYRFEDFELRADDFSLFQAGTRVRLEPKAMQVLLLLASRNGRLVDKQSLLNAVWPDAAVEENTLTRTIAVLRRSLGDNCRNPRIIETVPTRGYRFVAVIEMGPGRPAYIAETRQGTQPRKPTPSPPVPGVQAVNPPTVPPVIPTAKRAWLRPSVGLWLLFAVAALAIGFSLLLQKTEYFWRNPLAHAQYQTVTGWDDVEQSATVSRDGHFVAFLSDRDGQMDVWVTQLGSGEFHNLTRGWSRELVNPSLRTLGFTPDGSFVTFWARNPGAPGGKDISVWAVPTLGGQPRPYLEGVAEYDWSRDNSRLAYHTPGPGDPLVVTNGGLQSAGHTIFTAPAGVHCHFPLWSPDGEFIYFVQGTFPDKTDIWRIAHQGGNPEKITFHNAHVSHPVMLDRRTLVYLADDPDGSGPWLYSTDVERRIPHRLTPGLDRYTSLAASADGRRLVLTLANPKRTLWRLRIDGAAVNPDAPSPIALTTGAGFSPRMGPNYFLYLSASSTGESLWKLANGEATELWRGQGVSIFGGPAISPDGQTITFSTRQQKRALLYLVQADGTNARVLSDSLDLFGDPAWAPDGESITSAAIDHGVPQLFRIPLDGGTPTHLVKDYATNPAWNFGARFVAFSGPDIGTSFSVKAATPDGSAYPLPPLTLTRGARHLAFLPGGHSLVVLRGDIQHKNLWVIDLVTGAETQLTNLPPDFNVRDFDLSPDGHEAVLERVQERSDLLMLDLSRP